MRWTERQAAMLAEMGIRVVASPDEEALEPVAVMAPEAVLHGSTPVTARSASPDPHPANVQPVAAAAPLVLRDRAPGIETMDWPALRDTVAGCTACKLCEGRTQTVFGIGHPRAHWMVVGEAPGEQEDRLGEPFVGKSGQLLDNMLRAIGLSRDESGAEGEAARQVYIANTVKCRPPFNRNPEPAELAQCEPFLVRQIQLVQPRIILAMGRFAVQSLLRSTEPIGRLRGRVHRYEGVPLVVTYHPAYLLRNPEDKARAWDDLCLAREAMAAEPG
jgi:uracil-DNA glycosylase family 4